MSNEIDWSKAPEGTKGWGLLGEPRFPVWFGIDWYQLFGKKGEKHFFGEAPGAFKRKELMVMSFKLGGKSCSPWDGTGLPPVGTVCGGNEYGEWVRLEVIAHYEGRAVCMLPCKERVVLADPGMLRPIRNPEQAAAEEREREINELVETIVTHYEYPKGAESYIGLARSLHNAGYRKTEQEHGHD